MINFFVKRVELGTFFIILLPLFLFINQTSIAADSTSIKPIDVKPASSFVLFSIKNVPFSAYNAGCGDPPGKTWNPKPIKDETGASPPSISCPQNFTPKPQLSIISIGATGGGTYLRDWDSWVYQTADQTWMVSGFIRNQSSGAVYCIGATVAITVTCVPN